MMSEEKTEVEVGGIKISGGKLMIIIPVLSALGGGLWGGFEFYKDYMDMKEKIQTYVAPDLSEFDKKLATLDEKLAAAQNSVVESNGYIKDIRTDLNGDIIENTKAIDSIDHRTRELDREVRSQVNNFDREMNARLRELEKETAKLVKELEKKVDDKIQKAWENPLAN
jgi:F0F1-type ATP synthase membrane subunit b/b'